MGGAALVLLMISSGVLAVVPGIAGAHPALRPIPDPTLAHEETVLPAWAHFGPTPESLHLGVVAPSAVTSTVGLASGEVLAGNAQPVNLLTLQALGSIPGSPEVIGTSFDSDQGLFGSIFGFNTSTDVIDQAVMSPAPNPVGVAYVPSTGTEWIADAGEMLSNGSLYTSGVTVLNLTSFTVAYLLASGNESFGVAYDPAGDQVAVTNAESNSVWLYNATTFAVEAKTAVGLGPVAVAYDPIGKLLLVADEESDALSELNASTGAYIGTYLLQGPPTDVVAAPTGVVYTSILNDSEVDAVNVTNQTWFADYQVGRNATSLAIDPSTRLLYVAGFGLTDNVTRFNYSLDRYAVSWKVSPGGHEVVIAGVGDRVVIAQDSWNDLWTAPSSASLPVFTDTITGAEPYAEVMDPQSATLFAIDYYTGLVSAVTDNETRVNNSIGVSLNPTTDAAALDTRTNVVWADSAQSYHIQIFNATTESLTHTIQSFSTYPGLLTYDPNEDRFYSATAGDGFVVPTSAASYASDPDLSAVSDVDSMYYDTPNGTLYVGSASYSSSPYAGTIAIINSSLDRVVRVVESGARTTAFAYDTENQAIYAFNAISDNVTVINAQTNLVTQTIALPPVFNGTFVSSAVYDPVDQLIYLVMANADAVWLLDPSNGTILEKIVVGDNPLTDAYDYASGAVDVVDATSGAISVIRDPARYTLDFHAEGLPAGTPWLIGAQNTTFFSSAADIDCFSQDTAAFAWFAYAANYFIVPTAYGNVTVNGTNVTIDILFLHNGIQQAVNFYQVGLPFNTEWNVTVNSSGRVLLPVNQTIGSHGSSILFRIVNGSYFFRVGGIPGYYATPQGGNFTVKAAALNLSIVWRQTNYSVTFVESGLPTGTTWEVSLGLLVGHSSTDSITLLAPNGTYPYAAQAVSGFNTTSAGNLTVNGAPVAQSVSFSSEGLPTQTSGTAGPPVSGALIELGIAALAAFLVVLAVVLEVRYRRTAAAMDPSEPTTAPPSDPPTP